MSLLDDAIEGLGPLPRNTAAGRYQAEEIGVSQGPEFMRIRALPRRRWQDAEDLPRLVELLSAKLQIAPGPPLFPMQAAALREFYDHGTCYTVADVGAGKTLLSFLLPVIRGHERALLLTYKSLLGKTEREFAEEAKIWQSAAQWKFWNYEKLSRSDDLLYEYLPTIIVADESFALKSTRAGCTKKLRRFLELHPECSFVPLSATPGDRSMNEYAHLLHAALGPHRAPVPPPGSMELIQWTQALDFETLNRRAAGCLALFSDRARDLDDIRTGVNRRIEETPGVIYHRVSDVPCSLYMNARVYDGPSAVLEHVRDTGDQMPDGRILETPLEKYQLMSTLGLGFARWIDPPPPDDWRDARRAWVAFAGEILDQDIPGIDTPGAVARACLNKQIDSYGVFEHWCGIKPTFKKRTRCEWFDDGALKDIAAWAEKNDGLVWVPFPELGDKLSVLTGRPFYHEGGLSADGVAVEQHPGTDSVIVSTGSNFKGRNLQKWSKMLIIGSGSSSVRLHQQIGREHRTGQKADAVEATFYLSSIEDLLAVWKARARAVYDKTAGGNRSHKLLLGDWLVPMLSELEKLPGARWRRR